MNQTEREVPAAIEAAIEQFGITCHVCGMDEDPPHLVWSVGEEKKKLRHAILAVLEPEWALRERCERLRRALIDEEGYSNANECDFCPLHPGDLADDLLTATAGTGQDAD
jgi:hypothetical protein